MVDGGADGFYAGATGYACLEDETPMTVYQVHHALSHPKLHTAVATLLLAEQGRIELDVPIAKYLAPSDDCVRNASKITVRQLLNHTSGLPEFDDNPGLYFKRTNHPYESITRDEIVKVICSLKPDAKPGERHEYSGTNFYLLTLLIDHVTGQDHGYFFRDAMYEPLGLSHTYYRVQDHYYYPDFPPGLVNLYQDRFGTGQVVNVTKEYHLWLTALPGCDGLVISPLDTTRFLGALFRGEIFTDPNSMEQMLQAVRTPDDGLYYGLGAYMSCDDPADPDFYVGHSGGSEGGSMVGFYFPHYDTVVTAFTNHGYVYDTPRDLWWDEFWPDLREALFQDR
jgi:D-alanyl-D-alanine carboxypeptidase